MATQGQATTPANSIGTEANAPVAADSATAQNVVTVTPPAAGEHVVIQVEAGQTILLQGINIATAGLQQVEGGLMITLANGGVIFLAGFVAAAQDANPPVIEISGLVPQSLVANEEFGGAPPAPEFGRVTISAADLLAAAQGQSLNLQPAAGPAGGGDSGGQRFGGSQPQDIGEGLGREGLLGNEDFGRAQSPSVFGETRSGDNAFADASGSGDDESAGLSGGGTDGGSTGGGAGGGEGGSEGGGESGGSGGGSTGGGGDPVIFLENDNPNVEISANTGVMVTHDETSGIQNGGSRDLDGDDVLGSTLPAAILNVFNLITDKGSDADVSAKDNGAIGFATSTGAMVTLDTQDFGGDGAAASGSIVYGFVDPAGADSGVDTTENQNIFLFLEDGLIVGRVGDENGDAAFALAMDSATGQVYVAQYLSLEQLTPGDGSAESHDEAIALTNGAVQVSVTITDGNGDTDVSTASVGAQIKFEDDGPQINSMVNAMVVSEPVQVVNGTYDAEFGADGLDFLTLALGDAAAGFIYAETGNPAVQAQVDVTGTATFTFYYTTSTDSDGNAQIEAYFDAAKTDAFFTLTVNTNGTYVFTLLGDSFLTETTIDFGNAQAGNFNSLEFEGVLVDALDAAGDDQKVNTSKNGLATGTNQNITEGETVTLRFDQAQTEVSLTLSKWTGNGSFATVDLVFLDADGVEIDTQTITTTKPSGGGSVLVDIQQGSVDPDSTDSTVFVDFEFAGLNVRYVDTAADTEGNLGFNLEDVTFGVGTSIGDFSVQFDLTATDNDGDSDTLDNALLVELDSGDIAAGMTLTGTSEDEILVGGTGADVLNGGAGDDTLVYDAADTTIDGGTGTDTLQADSGDDIDLSLFSGTLAGIEVIDLATDAGVNALNLAVADVLQSDTNTVTVLGDAGDSIKLNGAWVLGASVDGFTAYTLGGATVQVDDTIANVTIF